MSGDLRRTLFEALTNWNETYWLLNLIDNSNASITVYGGTFVLEILLSRDRKS